MKTSLIILTGVVLTGGVFSRVKFGLREDGRGEGEGRGRVVFLDIGEFLDTGAFLDIGVLLDTSD